MTLRWNSQITIISGHAPTKWTWSESKWQFSWWIKYLPISSSVYVCIKFPMIHRQRFWQILKSPTIERPVSLWENSKPISVFHHQPDKNNHMWTLEYPDGIHRAQVDLILLIEIYRNSIRKFRSHSTVVLKL